MIEGEGEEECAEDVRPNVDRLVMEMEDSPERKCVRIGRFAVRCENILVVFHPLRKLLPSNEIGVILNIFVLGHAVYVAENNGTGVCATTVLHQTLLDLQLTKSELHIRAVEARHSAHRREGRLSADQWSGQGSASS